MKKLFIAAMALAAMVSCSKDEVDTVLSTNQKTVKISIANVAAETRAEVAGGQTAAGEAVACAKDTDLKFLFADATGKILVVKGVADAEVKTAWAGGTDTTPATAEYTFHLLPETVMMMGVAANSTKAAVGANLKDVYDEWQTETAAIEYDKIVAYSTNAAENGEFNSVKGIDLSNTDTTCKYDGHEWPLYSASVRVAPAHARIEILEIGCTDLGENEYGYSQITLNKLTLAGVTGGNSYTQALTQVLTPDAKVATLTDEVWSWNILPQAVSDMTLAINVVGRNYNVPVPAKTVTVNSYKVNGATIDTFDAENIYKIKLNFLESNIDYEEAYVCVNVDVEVANWVINTTDIGFAEN